MDLNLKNKRALVVAASSGLGAACAQALAREGAEIAICSSNTERIRTAGRKIEETTGKSVVALTADISDPEQLTRLLEEARESLGGIDILVTNCGGPPAGNFSDLTRDDWEKGFKGVLLSVLDLCRNVIPEMASRNWGRVVMISSVSARHPIDGLIVSNTLRAGLLGLVRSLTREYSGKGVLINTVLPGYMATDRLLELARERAAKAGITEEALRKSWEQEIPMERIGDPSELGDLVAFLCSDRASYIAGTAVSIDGGYPRGLP